MTDEDPPSTSTQVRVVVGIWERSLSEDEWKQRGVLWVCIRVSNWTEVGNE